MTRRVQRKRRVLSVNAYIHRATLGLPKDERLDAAAELRAHLLERIAEYESQGFSREEAEYLAVKGMGEPNVTNRELLGHFFTNRAGWLTLAVVLTGIAAWGTYRATHWVGVREVRPIALDQSAINQMLPSQWPFGTGYRLLASEIKFPPSTQRVYLAVAAALNNPQDKSQWLQKGLIQEMGSTPYLGQDGGTPAQRERFWKGRFRLLSSVAPAFANESCKGGYLIGLKFYGLDINRPKVDDDIRFQQDKSLSRMTFFPDNLSGACIKDAGLGNHLHSAHSTLPLNHWVPVMSAFTPDVSSWLYLVYASDNYQANQQDFYFKQPQPYQLFHYDPKTFEWTEAGERH